MLGYLLATATVQNISVRFGLRAIAIVSPLLRLAAALVLTISPSFGILLVTYACFGYGTGLTDTSWNAWASRMSRPNVAQGLLHGSFSLGCVLGPVIAVALLKGYSWNKFYSVVVSVDYAEMIWCLADRRRHYAHVSSSLSKAGPSATTQHRNSTLRHQLSLIWLSLPAFSEIELFGCAVCSISCTKESKQASPTGLSSTCAEQDTWTHLQLAIPLQYSGLG